MVIPIGQPIAMPKPFGSNNIPVIRTEPRSDADTGIKYSVYITGAIEDIYQFLELADVLLVKATEDDLVDIYLDTPGGCVFSSLVIITWMKTCKAKVTVVASGLVASAGTFLWFFADNRKIEDWSHFMFHYTSHGDVGRTLSIAELSAEMVNYMQEMIKKMVACGLITAEEAQAMCAQKKDLHKPGKLLRARLMEAMAATEGLKFVAEDAPVQPDPDAGEGSENDHETDPEGTPDPNADDDLDGETTEINPEAIFRAEGVEPETAAPGEGEDAQPGEGADDDNADDAEGKKKKAKKAKKGKKRCKGEGEEGDSGEGAGEGEPGSEENPVAPEEATDPEDFLKW